MRKSLIAGVAVLGLFVGSALIARAESKDYKGVLIDQKCGAGKDEASAAKHSKTCCLKEGCAKSVYELISGKTEYKFDDASSDKVKEYFDKHDSVKVVVKGEEKDGKLSVSSIEEQKAEK